MKRVLVIGGGISGLIAAFEVRRQAAEAGLPVQVDVLEAAPGFGGKARTEKRDGFVCEEGPNGFLDSKPPALTLCERLGISDALLRSDQSAAIRYIFSRGKLRRVPSGPGGFLLSPLLSWGAKLRFLREPWVAPAPPEADETLEQFATRRLGPQAAARMLDPMVSGVYAGDIRQISVRAAFPRIHAMEQEHGSLVRAMLALMRQRRRARKQGLQVGAGGGPSGPAGRLTCFRGGMSELVDALVAQVEERCRWTGWQAAELQRRRPADGGEPDGWTVRARQTGGSEKERSFEADAVVLATEADRAAELVRPLDEELAAPLAAIPYASATMVGIGYKLADLQQAPHGFGFLIPSEERREILGCLWSSCIFPGQRAPDDSVLFGVITGGMRRPELAALTADEQVELVRRELAVTMGLQASPCFTHVRHWPQAIPQYTVGHVKRVARAERALSSHPGLFVTGNSLHGIALPDCAAAGDRVAGQVVAHLQRSSSAGELRVPLATAEPKTAAEEAPQ